MTQQIQTKQEFIAAKQMHEALLKYCGFKLNQARLSNDLKSYLVYLHITDLISDIDTGLLIGHLISEVTKIISLPSDIRTEFWDTVRSPIV